MMLYLLICRIYSTCTCTCTLYMYISALHKAGKQGAAPRYFSKRPAMRPALKIIKFKIIND